MLSVEVRCQNCGAVFATIVYPMQTDIMFLCSICGSEVRSVPPQPPPEALPFSWERSGRRPQSIGIRLLPKGLRWATPVLAIVSAVMILASSAVVADLMLTYGGQNVSLTGTIYTYQGNERAPLSGVRVELRDMALVTSTDESGRFDIPNVSPGEHTLRLSHVNHSTVDYHVVVFPMISESVELDLPSGSGYLAREAGRFRSISEIEVRMYSSSAELVFLAMLLFGGAVMLLRRQHLMFVLVSFVLGSGGFAFLSSDLPLPWTLLVIASGVSFVGVLLTLAGRDEFEDPVHRRRG